MFVSLFVCLSCQKRRQQLNLKTDGLDEQTIELLEAARREREQEEEEIRLLREKRVSRDRAGHHL